MKVPFYLLCIAGLPAMVRGGELAHELPSTIAAPLIASPEAKPRTDAFPWAGWFLDRKALKEGAADHGACSGFLISSRCAITAQHCFLQNHKVGDFIFVVEPDPVRHLIAMNEAVLKKQPPPKFRWAIAAADSIPARGYAWGKHHANDLILIRLDRPIALDAYPELPLGESAPELNGGAELVRVGYGDTADPKAKAFTRRTWRERFASRVKHEEARPSDSPVEKARAGDSNPPSSPSLAEKLEALPGLFSYLRTVPGGKFQINAEGDSGGPLLLGNTVIGVSSRTEYARAHRVGKFVIRGGEGIEGASAALYSPLWEHRDWLRQATEALCGEEAKPLPSSATVARLADLTPSGLLLHGNPPIAKLRARVGTVYLASGIPCGLRVKAIDVIAEQLTLVHVKNESFVASEGGIQSECGTVGKIDRYACHTYLPERDEYQCRSLDSPAGWGLWISPSSSATAIGTRPLGTAPGRYTTFTYSASVVPR